MLILGPPSGLIAQTLVALAESRPHVDILCAHPDEDAVKDIGKLLVAWTEPASVGTVSLDPAFNPMKILFPNGSRILCRAYRDDGAGITGMHPDVAWWAGPIAYSDAVHPGLAEIHRVLRRSEEGASSGL